MGTPFTKEDIKQARQADIVAYLESVNEAARQAGEVEPYRLKREGKEIRVEGHGGLLVDRNYWSIQSDKQLVNGKMVTKGGNTLDFLTQYEGKTFNEAMKILTGKEFKGRVAALPPREYVPAADKSDFKLPERFENSRRAIAYLTKTRGISAEVVIDQVRKGNIYEDKDHHNVVFVGRSPDGEPRWANKRSTLTQSSYKGDAPSTDPRYPFVLRNEINRNDGYLIATESPIEAMSYATLLKIQGQQSIKNDIMGIGGAHGVGIIQYLKDHPQTQGVILALNNDRQGHESTLLIEQELKAHGFLDRKNFVFRKIQPKDLEDWNDYLKDQIRQQEATRKFNEERGIVGEVKIQLQPGQEPQKFLLSKNKIIRNGAETVVLYGENNIATLNTSTRTFGISEKGKEIKDTYFVKKVQIDDQIKQQVFDMVDKAIETEKVTNSKTVEATGRMTNEQLLAKDPKELSTEEAIKAYKLRQQMKKQQTRGAPAKAPMRERVQAR